MLIPALRSVLDRVETWPEERQEEAAALLDSLDGDPEDRPDGAYRASDEDRAEIRRRPAADEPRIGLAEVRTRLRRLPA